jgi:methylase of polypeptide subunit release factors
MLVFGDPVKEDDARAVLGDVALGPLVDAGFLVQRDAGFASAFSVGVLDDQYLLYDDLRSFSDAVMGLSDATVTLARAALPGAKVEAALDLGCGSGTAAFVLAQRAARVIATDVNPRALELARVGIAMNGLTNVELRQGDLFEPVAGERFDVIASQPPFVGRPPGAADATFMYGGSVGDELSLRLLGELPGRLSAMGRAVLLIAWPLGAERSLAQRLSRAIGTDELDVAVLQAPPTPIDEHCAEYAAAAVGRSDEVYEKAFEAQRDHFEKVGVAALSTSLTVIQPARRRPGSVVTIPSARIVGSDLTSAAITAMFEARGIAADPSSLAGATLRVPSDTVFAEERTGLDDEDATALFVRFPGASPKAGARVPGELLKVVSYVHLAPTVRDGLHQIADDEGAPREEAIRKLLPIVRDALLRGVLTPAADPG